MAAATKRQRWTAAGRELERLDPERFGALLALAEGAVRAHRTLRRSAARRAAILSRAAAALALVAACASAGKPSAAAEAVAVLVTGPGPDAAVSIPDAPRADAAPDAAPFCLASSVLGRLCLASAPVGDRVLSSTIDTSSGCTELHDQGPGMPQLCIIAGASIDVPAGEVLAFTGGAASVLVATGAITVRGTLDVSAAAGSPGAPASCAVPLTTDTRFAPQPVIDALAYGLGGGAGGSMTEPAGPGGWPYASRTDDLPLGGVPSPLAAPGELVGGCPGGRGSDGNRGPLPTPPGGGGGRGGGAVYVLAGGPVDVTGRIDASGGPGGAGLQGRPDSIQGVMPGTGGGGGGSGGMVVLEGPRVTVSGAVLAIGGTGGTGGGAPDPAGNITGGGPGGAGATATVPAAPGGDATITAAAGGGGGGGPGIVRTFGPQVAIQ